eukprot:scaffold16490_cov113-Cylindrotheca_fusiformis.AAC.4
MASETILVIGATGMLGEPVARRLVADGHNVKVMSRQISKVEATFAGSNDDDDDDDITRPHITCVQGDVSDLSSLQAAMKDCTGIHINLSGGEMESFGTLQVIKAAKRTKSSGATITGEDGTIRRISLISGATISKETTWYKGTKAKLEAENYLIESGFEYTIFRCTMFLETLPKWNILLGDQPTKWHWLAAQDYARMVSKSFTTPGAANKVLFVYGPGPSYTLSEAVNDFYIPICDPSRQPIQTIDSLEELRKMPSNEEYLKTSMSEKRIAKLNWLSKVHELGDPSEANDLLGAPTISLEEWCKDYRNQKN